jgi:hypothetical protein
MRKYPTLILFLAILFTACSKNSSDDNSPTISAMVIDFDSQTPIEGAKVFFKQDFQSPFDSTITDVNGRASIAMPSLNPSLFLHIYARKNGLLPLPYGVAIDVNRLDNTSWPHTIALARPSFVNLIVHQQGPYNVNDSIIVSTQGLYKNDNSGLRGWYEEVYRGKAISTDKNFPFKTIYHNPAPSNPPVLLQGYSKAYFKYEIIRGGSIITTRIDSTNLIQFGTVSFTLNY